MRVTGSPAIRFRNDRVRLSESGGIAGAWGADRRRPPCCVWTRRTEDGGAVREAHRADARIRARNRLLRQWQITTAGEDMKSQENRVVLLGAYEC